MVTQRIGSAETMQDAEYALLRSAELLVSEYEQSELVARNAVHLAALRAATQFLNPRAYRGTARQPLEAYATLDPVKLQQSEPPEGLKRNPKARRRFREI